MWSIGNQEINKSNGRNLTCMVKKKNGYQRKRVGRQQKLANGGRRRRPPSQGNKGWCAGQGLKVVGPRLARAGPRACGRQPYGCASTSLGFGALGSGPLPPALPATAPFRLSLIQVVSTLHRAHCFKPHNNSSSYCALSNHLLLCHIPHSPLCYVFYA